MKNETGNLIIRIVTTIGIYLWHNASVFIIYLVLNVLDILTGMLKAKDSRQGLQGVTRSQGSHQGDRPHQGSQDQQGGRGLSQDREPPGNWFVQGVLRKLGCWILIFVSFLVSIAFVDIGKKLNLNLHIMFCLGWYVLGAMILNELRSIIKNLIQLHVFIPKIFTKCLQEIENHFK